MKRLPIIRHLRWLWHGFWMLYYAQRWAESGIGLGVPNEADERELAAIWEGKA